MRIIGVLDPGKKSGLVTYDVVTGEFVPQELDFDHACSALFSLGNQYRDELTVIAESFIIGPQTVKNTQAPWSLELIGVARAVSRLWTGKDLHLSAPASAKRFSSDARLKFMGWHRPGKGHANDAARHLLLVMVERGYLSTDTVRQLTAVV